MSDDDDIDLKYTELQPKWNFQYHTHITKYIY